MKTIIKEIESKSILSKSKIMDYVINPYVGCEHACTYCYARFMKRFTGHKEPWGEFVDIKMNAAELLAKTMKGRRKKGTIWISGVCDPYQPIEEKYGITRQCLEVLTKSDWPVIIQTRSPLVARDIDLLEKIDNIEVCLSIPTMDDEMRRVFEPHAPSIESRIRALKKLHENNIKAHVMIAPILPGAENLIPRVAEYADFIISDKMNYTNADKIYRSMNMMDKKTDIYFENMKKLMQNQCDQFNLEIKPAY